jgi:predicted RNA binding protein YcfA (HicA-like mRNA interferase family)
MTKGMSSREIISFIEADGWFFVKTVGDHHHYKHLIKQGKVTITHPRKDIPLGTLRSIYRQAGLDWKTRS